MRERPKSGLQIAQRFVGIDKATTSHVVGSGGSAQFLNNHVTG